MKVNQRKMATIAQIKDIKRIDGEDNIELAIIKGWQVAVKKGEFNIGDIVIYCEIDSLIPEEIAPYLTINDKAEQYKNIVGYRIRTELISGELSQGLVLPLSLLGRGESQICTLGEDVSNLLGINKWDGILPPSGTITSEYPSFIPRPTQERVQNIELDFCGEWEITEKLKGEPATFYIKDGVFSIIASADYILDARAKYEYTIEEQLRKMSTSRGDTNLAIQGELIGSKLQNSYYNIDELKYCVFNIFDIDAQKYIPPEIARNLCDKFSFEYVPIIQQSFFLENSHTIADIIAFADGDSYINYHKKYAGAVFKSACGQKSFKAIGNGFLLKNNS